MNNKTIMAVAALAAVVLPVSARSVAFEENFNRDGDYTVNFPTVYDLDHAAPASNINPLFMGSDGKSQPWWPLADSGASDDRFLGSHALYQTDTQSNDWVVSRPIEIPTTDYVLTFGAQSYVMYTDVEKYGDRRSDLWVFITEERPTVSSLPTEPVMHIQKVPIGKFEEDIEGDFTTYTLNLDEYAGKTIYLSFANLNRQCDILCIDDVLIARADETEMSASSVRYQEKGQFDVNVNYGANTDGVADWKLVFDPGTGAEKQEISGTTLNNGEMLTHTFSSIIEGDQTATWTVSLEVEGQHPVVASGQITGLGFLPWHRVLVEEATGSWCGNCPMGIFLMEQMLNHEEMKDYVIPVSVHINGMGTPDYMVDDNYSYMLGLTAAPTLRIDRSPIVRVMTPGIEAVPIDLTNSNSIAYLVKERHNEIAFFDIETEGFISYGNVMATVKVRPALSLTGGDYRIGFALLENNVSPETVDPSYQKAWAQENYLSGVALEGNAGGLTTLPKTIMGWKYHDVARGIYDFHGHDDIVLPYNLEMGKEYEYTVTLPIPRTLRKDSKDRVMAPEINEDNLVLVAFILEGEANNFGAINSATFALGEKAEERESIADQIDRITNGVSGVNMEFENGEAEYYTLDGVRVDRPAKGLYIKRQGGKAEKVIL